MTTRWIYRDEIEEDAVIQFAQELNINTTIAKILIQRGISTFEQAKSYFRPSLDQLHDPFLMRDMDRALQRIKQAFDQEAKDPDLWRL
jgi:single-stranded-DNA-specific exonuclease